MGRTVEPYTTCGQHFRLQRLPPRPAKDSLYASNNLSWAEGFGNVVVGTHLQANQLIGLVDARRQHDDWHVGVATNRASHLHAVHFRHHQVENDQVWPHAVERLNRLLPV